ncbi:hypothetical protein AB1K89_09040 [Sporosarcina sp. 179-K 8C2 HS]|uniref:hypothetical protein n=1 Tax=Sporosarcina sp. 179-K 8C2 HS TaxID=3142387 RepID=UPI0039A1481E
MNKEKAFIDLYQLLIFYSENRDLPVPEDFNFFDEIKKKCAILELDFETISKEFNL